MISNLRFAAYACLLAGTTYVLIVICAMFSPDSIASYVASDTYFKDFESYRMIFIVLKSLMMISNMAMIAVVMAFYALRRDENEGPMAWISIMAIIGYAVGMLQSVEDMTQVPYLASQYATASVALKQAIIAFGVANPMIYILSLGLPGIWFLFVSWKALSNQQIPKGLIILGFLWGIGNILTVIAHALVILPLIKLVAVGALVFAPLWSIYEAIFLFQTIKKLSSS